MSVIDNLFVQVLKKLLYRVKALADLFFQKLRGKKYLKPNIFIILLFIFSVVFLSIFQTITIIEVKSFQRSVDGHLTDSTSVLLDDLVKTYPEILMKQFTISIIINLIIVLLLIVVRAEALLMLSMKKQFKQRREALYTLSKDKKYIESVEFKWGALGSFREYEELLSEIDERIK